MAVCGVLAQQRLAACSASSSPGCQQQHAAPARLAGAPRRPQPWLSPGLQQLRPQRPSLAARRRGRAAAAVTSIATASDGGSGGGEGGGADAGLRQLLGGAYDWLCAVKPPKWAWRSMAALVLGGEALVRILQGARAAGRPPPWRSPLELNDVGAPPRCPHPAPRPPLAPQARCTGRTPSSSWIWWGRARWACAC